MGSRVTVGALQMVATRFMMRGVGLISTMMLARLLTPDDFGVVGLAAAGFAVLDSLTETGFNLALVRMQDPQPAHYDTAWTMNLLRGVILALALVATSDLQAQWFGEPRIKGVILVLAATTFVQSLESVRMIDFYRNLHFNVVMRYTMAGKMAGFVVVLTLAVVMQNYWPLVLSNLLSRVFVTIPYSYRLAPHRPRFTLAAWRDLYNFSKWLALANIGTLADDQLMNIVIGRFVSTRAVGFYQVISQVAILPLSEIAAPIRQPFVAGLSRLNGDIPEIRRLFLKGIELQSIVILPLVAGIAVTHNDIVTVFLGSRWSSGAAPLPWIACYALLDAIGHYTHTLFLALNRQRSYTVTFYATLIVRVPATIAGAIYGGVNGAIIGMLASSSVSVVLWSRQAGEMIGLSAKSVLHVTWRSCVALLPMCAAVAALNSMSGDQIATGSALRRLALASAVGALVYGGTVIILWVASGAPEDSGEAQLVIGCRRLFQRFASPKVDRAPSIP